MSYYFFSFLFKFILFNSLLLLSYFRDYTAKAYLVVQKKLFEKSKLLGGTWTSEDVGRVLWIISIFSANNKELNLIKNLNKDLNQDSNENKVVNKKLKRINEQETLIETDEKDEKDEEDEKNEKNVISNKNKKIKK